MYRWSYFAAVSVAFVLAISIAGANEELSKIVEKVGNLEREIIDYKMARADSWMFWMAVFMTLAAVTTATFAVMLPLMGNKQQDRFRQEMEKESEIVAKHRREIEQIRIEAQKDVHEISSMRNRGLEILESYPDNFSSEAAARFMSQGDDGGSQSTNRVDELVQKIRQAGDFFEEKNFSDARKIWLEIAEDEMMPLEVRAMCWTNFGNTYLPPESLNRKDNLRALEAFNSALELNPDDLVALNSRGLVKTHLKKYGEAVNDYNKIIDLEEPSYKTYANRANTFFLWDKLDEAIKDSLASLAIVDDEDEKPSILFQLGTFYFSIGDIKSAFASFEQAKQVASGEVLDRVTERIDGFFSSIEVTEN